jgi:hypothetical protein
MIDAIISYLVEVRSWADPYTVVSGRIPRKRFVNGEREDLAGSIGVTVKGKDVWRGCCCKSPAERGEMSPHLDSTPIFYWLT